MMTLANAYEPHVQKVSLSVHTIIYYIHLQPIDSDVAWYKEIDPPYRNDPHIYLDGLIVGLTVQG